MRKEDKSTNIEHISSTINEYAHFYIVDLTALDAEKTSKLRRKCFENEIRLIVVKNKLLHKAMENMDTDFSPLYGTLKGSTALMFSNAGNVPAKVLKEYQKEGIPSLKGAYVEESFYDANQLDALISIKSKNEVIADIITLLQSPAKNVISALQSGGNTIHGVLKALEER